MVRLMKMSLGLNEKTAEAFLSPSKTQPATADEDDYDIIEEVYV